MSAAELSATELIDGFVAFSAEVTGHTAFELRGTGETEAYLDAAIRVVGVDVVEELVAAHQKLSGSADEREALLRADVFGDAKLGPVARAIVKMWFSGLWYELPVEWHEAHGRPEQVGTFAVRPSSYAEGLLWKTIGANPPGAKAPGYGSWADPPRIPDPSGGPTSRLPIHH